MEKKVWTVDTWVLYKAAEGDFDAIAFLANILRRHVVVFDHEGHIMGEYIRCKERTRSKVIDQWLGKLAERQAKFFYSGQLENRHQRELQQLRFDLSDMPFVAVCYRTPNKLLVAEESDYNEAVKEYLNKGMGIQVLTITEALNQT